MPSLGDRSSSAVGSQCPLKLEWSCEAVLAHRIKWGDAENTSRKTWLSWHIWFLPTSLLVVVVVQSLRCVRLFVTPWSIVLQAPLTSSISRSLFKFMSIESVMPSNHLILCRPLLLLPSIFPHIRVSSNEFAFCIWWPEYCSFSFSICPSNEYSGLISFRIDWFDLLAVQGTLKSLL